MATLIFPSSFSCDCGNQSDFFERTISEMEKMSRNKKVFLQDDNNHKIIFRDGKAVKIVCPKLGECSINNKVSHVKIASE